MGGAAPIVRRILAHSRGGAWHEEVKESRVKFHGVIFMSGERVFPFVEIAGRNFGIMATNQDESRNIQFGDGHAGLKIAQAIPIADGASLSKKINRFSGCVAAVTELFEHRDDGGSLPRGHGSLSRAVFGAADENSQEIACRSAHGDDAGDLRAGGCDFRNGDAAHAMTEQKCVVVVNFVATGKQSDGGTGIVEQFFLQGEGGNLPAAKSCAELMGALCQIPSLTASGTS